MAKGNYEDSGRLWPNRDKQSEKAPDWTGELTISRATLRRMKEAMDGGEAMKIRIAAWKDDNKPKEISLKVSEPREGGGRSRGNGGRQEGKSYSDSDNDRPRRDYDRDDRRQDRDFPGDRAMKRNSRDEPDDDAW
jgi:hypothetical protein